MMFNLIVDKENLPVYSSYLGQFFLDSTHISKFSYEFLRRHCRPIVSSIFGEQFIPVKILVSIRTDRTNELIVPDHGNFYTDCTLDYANEHPLDDAVLLSAKKLIDRCFDCGEDIVKVIPRTAPLPIGACFINNVFYVYVSVVVDHTLKDESFFKLKDCHYESIQVQNPRSVLELELKDSLAIVYNLNPEEDET